MLMLPHRAFRPSVRRARTSAFRCLHAVLDVRPFAGGFKTSTGHRKLTFEVLDVMTLFSMSAGNIPGVGSSTFCSSWYFYIV